MLTYYHPRSFIEAVLQHAATQNWKIQKVKFFGSVTLGFPGGINTTRNTLGEALLELCHLYVKKFALPLACRPMDEKEKADKEARRNARVWEDDKRSFHKKVMDASERPTSWGSYFYPGGPTWKDIPADEVKPKSAQNLEDLLNKMRNDPGTMHFGWDDIFKHD